MTSHIEKQTITIHILPNISRSKGNQTKESCQLVEYNMRNIFLEESYTKCGGETIPRPFYKIQNWVYLWIKSLNFYTVCTCAKSKAIERHWDHILKPWSRPLAITSCNVRLFWKTNKDVYLFSLPHFLHDFLGKKPFLLIYSINWPNLVIWLPLLREILGNMCILLVC